jgi:2-polyprenyl-6-methoxyphenol hydroxylase-like FAD-dependent oxidoreductase
MAPFDIAIYGNGFVGSALALALAKHGFSIGLVGHSDIAKKPKDIRAFALGRAAKSLLSSVNAWPDSAHATPVLGMAVYGDKGGAVEFGSPLHSNRTEDAEPLNWIVDVPALTQRLGEQVAGEPRIVCHTRQDTPQAKLHVACEGRHSKLPYQIGIEADTILYPQHAIAARLSCELPHQHIARQWFDENGQVLALLPLQGQEVALVWSLTSSNAKSWLNAKPELFTAALEAACACALGRMTLTSALALWPLTLSKTNTWTRDNWVLAGDAAHTVHPMAGQGLNLGLGDASALTEALYALKTSSPRFTPTPTELGRTLRRYARARQAAAGRIQWASDSLHLLFKRPGAAIQLLRNGGMNAFNQLGSMKQLTIEQAQ